MSLKLSLHLSPVRFYIAYPNLKIKVFEHFRNSNTTAGFVCKVIIDIYIRVAYIVGFKKKSEIMYLIYCCVAIFIL